MVRTIRPVGVWGWGVCVCARVRVLTTEGCEGTFWGEWNILCLGRVVGYPGVCICENSSNGTLKICAFVCINFTYKYHKQANKGWNIGERDETDHEHLQRVGCCRGWMSSFRYSSSLDSLFATDDLWEPLLGIATEASDLSLPRKSLHWPDQRAAYSSSGRA